MTERKYKVMINNDVVAENVDLRTASILMRALFEEYNNDYSMTVSVKEMERVECR